MDDVPPLEESDSDSEWMEADQGIAENDVRCLFCNSTFRSAIEVFKHCSDDHKFNIKSIQKFFNLDTFSFIRMINYIRRHNSSPEEVLSLKQDIWMDDLYMKPVQTDDPLLMIDIDDIDSISDENNEDKTKNSDSEEIRSLKSRLDEADSKCENLSNQLESLIPAIATMRTAYHRLLLQSDKPENDTKVKPGSSSEHDDYFGSYSHFDIHHTMLTDSVRTKSYQDAICNNCESFTGKTVLDVGCGSGILSMFCATAGADHVIGIDQSEIIYNAMEIVRENGLDSKITLVKGRLEDTFLPFENQCDSSTDTRKVDVIISEWMGYFLHFECMLESIIYARDKYLKPGGLILPDRFTIIINGISNLEEYNKNIKFWDDVYGYKMSCMKKEVLKEASIEIVDQHHVVTDPVVVHTLDAYTCTIGDIEFKSDFNLKVTKSEPITAIIGYFETYFDANLKLKVMFSTSPSDTKTHWKQTVFYLREPINCSVGDVIPGKLICRRHKHDSRSLIIDITLLNLLYTFVIQ